MKLDSEELEGLAAVLERRFPPGNPRQELLREAGVDDADAWSAIVHDAAESGALERLVAVASRMRPDDENLQALSDALGGGVPRAAFVAAGAVLVLLGVGAGAWYTSADDKISAIADEAPSEAAPEPSAPVDEPVKRIKAPGEFAAPNLSPSLVPPFAKKANAPEAGTAEQPPAEPDVVDGRCGGERGQRVGYWYAGFPFEARKGDSYTIKHGANVRKAHPSAENGWTSDAPIVCTLNSGDTVLLSADPLLIEGGKYWVPLNAGDLQ